VNIEFTLIAAQHAFGQKFAISPYSDNLISRALAYCNSQTRQVAVGNIRCCGSYLPPAAPAFAAATLRVGGYWTGFSRQIFANFTSLCISSF